MAHEEDCTRCGWCCQHVLVKRLIHAVSSKDREWMEARGIRVFRDQIVIPSTCEHLGAENIGILETFNGYQINKTANEKWVCRCMIQNKKPKVCIEGKCIKKQYPGIDKIV